MEMSKVVKYLIFLLISVADPLSIAFVIAINVLIKKRGKKEEPPKKEYKFLKWFKKKEKTVKEVKEVKENNFDLKESNKRIFEENIKKEENLLEELVKDVIVEQTIEERPILEMIIEESPIKIKPKIDTIQNIEFPEPEIIVNEEPEEIISKTEDLIGENGPILEEEEIPINDENKQEIFLEDLQLEDKKHEVKSNSEEIDKLSIIKDNIEESLVLDNVLPEKNNVKDENYMKNDFWEDIEKEDEDFWKDDLTPKKKDEDFWNI